MPSQQTGVSSSGTEASKASETSLRCNILVRRGQINEAVETILDLQQDSQAQDEVYVTSRTFLAELFGQFHRWDQAHKHLVGIEPMTSTASRLTLARFNIASARTSSQLGQFAQATESLANARSLLDADRWPVVAAQILMEDADLHLRMNNLDAAERLAAKSCTDLITHQNCFQEMKAKEVLARVRIAQGEYDAAWSLLEDPRIDAMPRAFRWSISPSRAQILRERKSWRALSVEHDVSLSLQSNSDANLLRTHAALWSKTTEADVVQKRVALARLNEQLNATNEEINELLSIVSHDLRSPLLATRLAVQMGGSDLDPCVRRRHLESAQATVSRIRQISAQLTTLECLESTAQTTKAQQIDVVKVAAAVIDRYEAAANHKQIRLSMLGLEGNLSFTTISDPTRITQILENLVSNALKFSHPGSNVEVDVQAQQSCTGKPAGSFLVITVRDNGPGFTEAERLRLFGKYTQLGARPTNGESSSGLGLHIAQALATTIDGYIDASSRGPGLGAQFSLFVPATRPTERATQRRG